MSPLSILIGQDNPLLRVKTKDVPKITREILQLLRDMRETVITAQGAGLAAPQVGRSERVCIAMIHKKLVPLINPQITWRSDTIGVAEEGCLSLPEIWIHVARPTDIVVHFTTQQNKQRALKLSSFDARVVQHEVDHLEGILITDHRQQAVKGDVALHYLRCIKS